MAEETLLGAAPVAGGGTGVSSPTLTSANEAEKEEDSAPVGGAENEVSSGKDVKTAPKMGAEKEDAPPASMGTAAAGTESGAAEGATAPIGPGPDPPAKVAGDGNDVAP